MCMILSESSSVGYPWCSYTALRDFHPSWTHRTIWKSLSMMNTGWFWSSPPPIFFPLLLHPILPHLLSHWRFVLKYRYFILSDFYQERSIFAVVTNDKKMLRFSGDNMIVPFFPDHDYIFVPSQTNRIVYYDRKPEILQNFSYFLIWQCYVWSLSTLTALIHQMLDVEIEKVDYPF